MEKLLDNTGRGKRAIFWMNIFFIVSLIITVLGFAIWNFVHNQVNDPNANLGMGMALVTLGLVAASILMFVVIIGLIISWVTWLFRSAQNLDKLSSKAMSPWAVTILSIIPFVGQIIHFFLFRSLIKGVQSELDSRNAQYTPVSMTLLNLYFGFTVAATLMAAFDGIKLLTGAGIILGYAGLAFYIKVLSTYVKQEQILFKACDDELLRQKVDQVLREREIAQAASQVQEATYENERSSSTDGD